MSTCFALCERICNHVTVVAPYKLTYTLLLKQFTQCIYVNGPGGFSACLWIVMCSTLEATILIPTQ
eukprot:5086060-Prorocentrum_lima.AAC.1